MPIENFLKKRNKSIHEFDFKLICEYYSNLDRQGPGSPEVTIKALGFIDNLNDKSVVADIGCGSGGQTSGTRKLTARLLCIPVCEFLKNDR